MNKVKKALEQIENKKQAPDALEYLTMLKSELSGREMSPDDFNTYEKLGEMEHSLYRYNSLLNTGLIDDAEKEGKNFFSMSQSPDGTLVLKGGISNCRYVWQTEKGACEACQALDGKEFETLDDVPNRPHPNCKCDIVPIENKKEDDNNEPCDCHEILENEIEKIVNSAYSLQSELSEIINSLLTKMSDGIGQFYHNICAKILDEAATWDNACGDFARNYNDMLEADFKYSDKYFHAKANCEAAQRGEIAKVIAEALSLLRELEEGSRKVIFEGNDVIKQIEDAKKDFEANEFGRKQGARYPNLDCVDLIDIYRPKDLPPKY